MEFFIAVLGLFDATVRAVLGVPLLAVFFWVILFFTIFGLILYTMRFLGSVHR